MNWPIDLLNNLEKEQKHMNLSASKTLEIGANGKSLIKLEWKKKEMHSLDESILFSILEKYCFFLQIPTVIENVILIV